MEYKLDIMECIDELGRYVTNYIRGFESLWGLHVMGNFSSWMQYDDNPEYTHDDRVFIKYLSDIVKSYDSNILDFNKYSLEFINNRKRKMDLRSNIIITSHIKYGDSEKSIIEEFLSSMDAGKYIAPTLVYSDYVDKVIRFSKVDENVAGMLINPYLDSLIPGSRGPSVFNIPHAMEVVYAMMVELQKNIEFAPSLLAWRRLVKVVPINIKFKTDHFNIYNNFDICCVINSVFLHKWKMINIINRTTDDDHVVVGLALFDMFRNPIKRTSDGIELNTSVIISTEGYPRTF